MKVKHKLYAFGRCPVDDAIDAYRVTVWARGVIKVEDIRDAVVRLTREPVFQETFTQQLAAELGTKVKTRCTHSGVITVCRS